ncbi:MAG: hypothetical protein U0T56_02305 [Ferruginibacter sp.]
MPYQQVPSTKAFVLRSYHTWNSQTHNSAGTYSVTLTGSTGCDSVVTLNLSVLPTTTSY